MGLKVHLSRGFSLMELMITVAIVGVLAAIAIPSYQSYVLKANRYEAISELLNIELTQERYYAEHHTYTDSFSDLGLPTSYKQYWFLITLYGHAEYTVKAEPFTPSTQWDDQKAEINCAVLQLDHRGVKTPPSCWER